MYTNLDSTAIYLPRGHSPPLDHYGIQITPCTFLSENLPFIVCVFVYAHVCECLRVDECPVPLVRVWLIHETEFVCGMPARHSCCMQIRGWKWICKSEIKTARGHDYNEHSKRENES